MLPETIPKRFRETAVPLPELGDDEGAWPRAEALSVLDALKGTTVAVSDVVVFNNAPWGFVPAEVGLSTDRLPIEGDADYAARSRSAAANFIRDCAIDSDDALFALTFPIWKDAA